MWTCRLEGERNAVSEKIKSLASDPKTPDEQPQLESAKAYIISEIAALPSNFNAVIVSAQGQTSPTRNTQVSVTGKTLTL